ncbi:MAG: DNA-binding protein [Lentisphaerae bacterium RIFOXYC12_FULL_60_16]|nr:MAG: DNA-binding protein [Lentisphaerae bacterium RIFOXYC12_FULL_60_16]OGV78203.1 MAG: DNA-binding protein [Lentisphaerae bacterium RIFOXYB12_FULL_60_10]
MKYVEGTQGRTFVVRLEDGDVIHESLEQIAREQDIHAASVMIIGGADAGSRLVVGPEQGRVSPVVPMEQVLSDVHEIAGVGTIFPNLAGEPVLHMHVACGRKDATVTGCVRRGVKAWYVMEAIIHEIQGVTSKRRPDSITGFELLDP